jgi:hypothetical protein
MQPEPHVFLGVNGTVLVSEHTRDALPTVRAPLPIEAISAIIAIIMSAL